MSEHCPCCGAEVRVVGRTTNHYEVVAEVEVERLREALEKLRDKDAGWVAPDDIALHAFIDDALGDNDA